MGKTQKMVFMHVVDLYPTSILESVTYMFKFSDTIGETRN